MSKYDYDLCVIGGGSGGVRAARLASQFGARVALAESQQLGGTCVNLGCIPKKLFVYGAHYRADFEDAVGYGYRTQNLHWHWPSLRENKNKEILRLNHVYKRLLTDAGVAIKYGKATIIDGHTVALPDTHCTAKNILIATGSWPWRPHFPGVEHTITSNEAFHLENFPSRVAIVGGGYIAVEFANIFNGLGAQVALIMRKALPLRGFDEAIRKHLLHAMQHEGIKCYTEAEIASVQTQKGGLAATLSTGKILETDCMLMATGRKPNLPDMPEGLVTLTPHHAIQVNDRYQTSCQSIYAIGDAIDKIALTPVAIKEGTLVAEHLCGHKTDPLDYSLCPTAVFSQPAIGTVGLTEAQARANYAKVAVFSSEFKPLRHTLSGRDEKTYMKLIVDETSDRVVGLHMLGGDAAEIIQGFAVALQAGATKKMFDQTIAVHPSTAEEFVTMRQPD